MTVPIYHVDAFAKRSGEGNPAAICFPGGEQSSSWMQTVAAEMNLSETAFVREIQNGYELRWFTPAIEVDLCGHATLAAAHVMWTEGMVASGEPITFHTRGGVLRCRQSLEFIEMDFPATPPESVEAPEGLLSVLGIHPLFVGRSKYDKLLVVAAERVVRSLDPDFHALSRISGMRGVIVSSRSDDPAFDFVSRYFAPAAGINEDPVTGSAHCCLGPYWSAQLGKPMMTGFQASRRGGVVRVRMDGGRVVLGGTAVTVVRGELV
jgi:PhzF family phenazine biosynthesis protein